MEQRKSSFDMHFILWGFCVAFLVYQYGIRSSIASVLNEDLQQYFSIDAARMGTLISLFYLSYTIMQIPVGLLIDKLSSKWISVVAFSLVSIGILALVSTTNIWIASLSQLFLGFGCSFAFVLVMKITNDYFPRERVAFISSIAISTGSLGPIIMNPLLACLSNHYFWKSVLLVIGTLGFILSAIGAVIILEHKLPPVVFEESEETKSDGVMSDLRAIFSNKQYFWIGIFSLLVYGAISTFCDAWGLSFLKHFYEVDKEQASYGISAVYFGTIVGGPLMAFLAGQLQSYRKVMLFGTTAMFALFSLVIYVQMPKYLLFSVLFMAGIASTCQFLVFPAALCQASKKIGATLTGFINTLTSLGSTILMWWVGQMMEYSSSHGAIATYSVQDYRRGLVMLLVFLATALISITFIKESFSSSPANLNDSIGDEYGTTRVSGSDFD